MATRGRRRSVAPSGVISTKARPALEESPDGDLGLRPTATWLYGEWLPRSGRELRDFPMFAQRISFFPDVPEHEAVTDIFLPIR